MAALIHLGSEKGEDGHKVDGRQDEAMTGIYAGLATALGVGIFAMGQTDVMAAESKRAVNHLAGSSSPYLLQHAHQPVEWYPWGEEAFAKARRENKPVFLSIGYSTCHWCHVMARESFDHPEIAAQLNRDFVCIKVDREERPDVDRVYMTFVQATTGGGGWPMSVWLTPELKPFFGGTYFPPTDRVGRAGFPTVLKRVTEAWRDGADKLKETADGAISTLRERVGVIETGAEVKVAEGLEGFQQALVRTFDSDEGGFGRAPKFPRPSQLSALLRVGKRWSVIAGKEGDGRIAAGMALATLRKMAAGGIRDQLGGGFHRYSVDRVWHVPHFEKMLYDQAQLACVYLEAAQMTGAKDLELVVREICDYVLGVLRDSAGGFHAAEDADSLLKAGAEEHAEGAYYVWTEGELRGVLSDEEYRVFAATYGVQPEGNAPEGSDPTGELKGKNTLVLRGDEGAMVATLGLGAESYRTLLSGARAKVLAAREARPRPHRDDKIVASWNGMMISALARAGAYFGEERYLAAASEAVRFLKGRMWKDGVLSRSHRGGANSGAGYAEDYACVVSGLIDLYEATGGRDWIEWAVELQQSLDAKFFDTAQGGYFSSDGTDSSVLLRIKEDHDGAEPAASSVAAENALRLSVITGDARFAESAGRTFSAFSGVMKQSVTALPRLLGAMDSTMESGLQVVVAADEADDVAALTRAVFRRYSPGRVVLWTGRGRFQRKGGVDYVKVEGKPTVYVCRNFVCQSPATEVSGVSEALEVAEKK
jgi:uncharacterized protein YyaL (SSP411 family)